MARRVEVADPLGDVEIAVALALSSRACAARVRRATRASLARTRARCYRGGQFRAA